MAGLLYLVLLSPVLAVRTVKVSGAPESQAGPIAEAVKQAASGRIGAAASRSLAVVDSAAIERSLIDKFPDLAAVQVAKKWPNSLQVSVQERQTGLVWKSGDKLYLIDRAGLAYAATPPRPDLPTVDDTSNLPVTIGKPVVGAGFIKVLLEIQQGMTAGGLKVASFRVPETTFEVQAVTDQGYYALFDTTRPVTSQVQALLTAVKTGKPAQYADVRVPGRVYIK